MVPTEWSQQGDQSPPRALCRTRPASFHPFSQAAETPAETRHTAITLDFSPFPPLSPALAPPCSRAPGAQCLVVLAHDRGGRARIDALTARPPGRWRLRISWDLSTPGNHGTTWSEFTTCLGCRISGEPPSRTCGVHPQATSPISFKERIKQRSDIEREACAEKLTAFFRGSSNLRRVGDIAVIGHRQFT